MNLHIQLVSFARHALAACTLTFIATTASSVLAASNAPASARIEQVRSVEGVQEYRLSNGLRVLLVPDDAKPLITVNMVYLVGSRHEGAGEGGMAHLLEHLVFKGTPTTADPKAQFTARGMQWNGTTSYDRTNYYATFSPVGDNLTWYLSWLADSMIHSFIAQKDLDSEMTVVRNEFERVETNSPRVLYQNTLATAYQWHPYGRPVIGALSDIENVSIPRLQRFYREFYQPDNAVLVVGGQIKPEAVLAEIEKQFGSIPRPSRQLETHWTVEPVQEGERNITVRRAGSVPMVAAAYHHVPAASKGYATQTVLRQILGHVPTGRLHQALIESGLAASLFDWTSMTADPGFVYLGAVLNEKSDPEKVLGTLTETLESFSPVTDEELRRAKTLISNAINRSLLDANDVAMSLTEYIAAGDWRLIYALRDWIDEVTATEVDAMAKQYFVHSNRTVGRFIPTEQPVRAPATPKADPAALLQDYTGRDTAAPIESLDPSNLAIESRTVKKTLPDGMKIALLPRTTRGERVTGTLRLHWGELATLTGRQVDALFLSSMMLKGTTSMSRTQLNDRLAELDATLNVSGGLSGLNVRLNAPRAKLDEALALLADALRNPVFPEAEFEQIRRSSLSQTQAGRSEPGVLAWNLLNRHLNKYPTDDPRSVLTLDQTQEAINKTSPDRLARFHRDFAGANVSEFVLVGPVDVEEVQKKLEQLFGGWKSPKPYARITTPWQDATPLREVINVPDKANAVFAAAMPVRIEEQDADVPALIMAVELLGGRPGARLWQRLREKDGLTYGVNASISPGVREPNGSFSISGTVAPQNLARFEAALKDEIAQVLQHGFTEQELADTKESILRARRQTLTQEGNVASILAQNLYWGRTMEWREQRDQAYAALSLNDVNAALRKYIDPSKLSVVVAGDFEKNPVPAAQPAPAAAH